MEAPVNVGDAEPPDTGVIARIAAILAAVQEEPRTAAQISRDLGFSRSTTYRLITDLREYRFIVRDPGGTLRLGPFPGPDTVTSTATILDRLRTVTGESVQLWVRVGEDRVCVRAVDSDQELRATSGVGAILPLVDGGSASQVLEGSGDPEEFYSTREAQGSGVASASVPFVAGGVRFALCVSYPLAREPEDVVAAFRDALLSTADSLGDLLGRSAELGLLRDISALSVGDHSAVPSAGLHL